MRILALAALFFAAGFGTVTIGQQASAYLSTNRTFLKLDRQAVALTGPQWREEEREKTFADYLIVANRAFAAMERTCSERHRAALGRAFHDLVNAAGKLRTGTMQVGGANRRKTDIGFTLSRLKIYSQVTDASRRGILKGRHYPLGAARLMHIRTRIAEPGGSSAAIVEPVLPDPAGTGSLRSPGPVEGFRVSKCRPA